MRHREYGPMTRGKTHKGKTQIIILLLYFFNCLAGYREKERERERE